MAAVHADHASVYNVAGRKRAASYRALGPAPDARCAGASGRCCDAADECHGHTLGAPAADGIARPFRLHARHASRRTRSRLSPRLSRRTRSIRRRPPRTRNAGDLISRAYSVPRQFRCSSGRALARTASLVISAFERSRDPAHELHVDGTVDLLGYPARHSNRRAAGMGTIDTSQFRNGLKIELDGEPFTMIYFQHVKPGKGGAFVRTRSRICAMARCRTDVPLRRADRGSRTSPNRR